MGYRAQIAALLLVAAVCQAASPKREARALAKKAMKAGKKGDHSQAYIWFSEASALQPANVKYRRGMIALQSRAALQKGAVAPPIEFGAGPANDPTPDVALDPEQVFTSITAREFSRARQPQSPQPLAAKPGRQNFDLTLDYRSLFDTVAKAFALNTVYDGDFPQGGAKLHFRVDDVDYREAFRALEAATNSFVTPLSNKLLMIAKDNQQKRNDLEQTITLTVPVPQTLTAQELTEMVAAVRQVTGTEKVAWDTAQSQIVIRDRMSRAIPAQLLLDQLVSYRPEIAIELEFLQVSDSDIKNYGFDVSSSFSAIPLGKILSNAISAPSGLANLVTFGGGKTLFGLGVAQVQAIFNGSSGTARSLFRTMARSADGQASTFHVGDKYPVITSGYYGASGGSTKSNFSPPPSYTFEDLGIVLKVTPHVHGEGQMTLAIETSYEVLAGSAVNGIPVIGNRKLTTQVRLKNDEWAIVAGMITKSKQKSTSGIWGLASIPWIGNLFKKVSKDDEDSHVLIAIKPMLLSLPPDQIVSRVLHVGTEVKPFSPL